MPVDELALFARVQRVAEEHLAACWAVLEDEPTVEGRAEVESPASEPFDGCQTCEVREVLAVAWRMLHELPPPDRAPAAS